MYSMKSIPKNRCLDNTIKLLLEGYLFIPSRCKRYQSDIFQTRLMGKKVICMSGSDAAEIFYDNKLFTRKGVIPKRIQRSLFGVKAIQTTVGDEHKKRKNLFMSMMTPARIDHLVLLTKREWEKSSKKLTSQARIQLFDEAAVILCRAACKWSGVPIRRSETRELSKNLSYMVDAFGAVGPRYWRGRLARIRTEKWMKRMIRDVRRGKIIVPTSSLLYKVAFYKDSDGMLLPSKIAGIEMINILRPITAIATYITFGALAMHLFPEYKRKLQIDDGNYSHMFAQEVRRYYPFGPFIGAKVRNDFIYNRYLFKKDTLVFLDLYGTNHDPRIWKKPYQFWPEHFKYRDGNPYDFIPQGGGDYYKGTRCPGEWITIELIKVSINHLANCIDYDVPSQNLSYSMRRIPTLPKSKFIIENVRLF